MSRGNIQVAGASATLIGTDLVLAKASPAHGRYESPELTADAVKGFLHQFGRFLREDSRHDLWVRSHDDDATIVLDRHNLIYAYGPLDAFAVGSQSLDVREGQPSRDS